MSEKYSVCQLLIDWLSAEVSVAGETSHDTIESYRKLIEVGKSRALDLGIPWDDEYVPDHVLDLIESDRDFREFWEGLK